MHFQAKNKEEIIDYSEYYGKDYTTYHVTSHIKVNEDSSVKNMLLALAQSFRLGAFKGQTYDLSNVSAGMRTIKDDTYKLSFKVPADFVQYTGTDAGNEFFFFSPDETSNAAVSLAVYSKTDEVTAQSLAERDHDQRVKLMNPAFSTISDVSDLGNRSFSYSHKISGSAKDDSYAVDIFLEKGQYIYNMNIQVDSVDDTGLVGDIRASLQTEELDPAVIGKLLRNDPDDVTLTTQKIGPDYTLELPTSWKGVSGSILNSNAYTASYTNSATGSVISVTVDTDERYTRGMLTGRASEIYGYIQKNPKNNIVRELTYDKIDDEQYACFTYTITDDDGEVSYATTYLKTRKNELAVFTLSERDIYYQKEGNDTFTNAIASLTKKITE